MSDLKTKISKKEAKIGVVGLGYVGVTFLENFGKAGFTLIGYDTSTQRVNMIKEGQNYLHNASLDYLISLTKKGQFIPSTDPSLLKSVDVIIICVPSSLDEHHLPDLSAIRNAAHAIVNCVKKE